MTIILNLAEGEVNNRTYMVVITQPATEWIMRVSDWSGISAASLSC
ncbi:MAG: hypothetical protein GDA44_07690 [Prochloron sp. SP5CPC1]|nr:hypothetical protein [Candidatus Paraprochloron terpiosi SP5CPC1]